MHRVGVEDAKKLIGKQVYCLKKDGTVASGKLVKVSGSRLLLAQPKGKKVRTSAVIPLVLFDLLAIGTAPYAYGGYGGFYGGYGGYGLGGYGYNGGFFW
jgi:hypothetical protein